MNSIIFLPLVSFTVSCHNVKLADVKEFIDSQQEQQIHKTINKRVKGAPIVTAIPNFNYQADLLDFKRYATKHKNYNWLLIVIDVLTRLACAVPLKQRRAEETYQGLHKAYDFISRGKVPFVLT